MDHHPHAARALHQKGLSGLRVDPNPKEDTALQSIGAGPAVAACPGKLNKQSQPKTSRSA